MVSPMKKITFSVKIPTYTALSTRCNPNRSWPFFLQSLSLSDYDKQLFIEWKCDRDVGFTTTSELTEDYTSPNS